MMVSRRLAIALAAASARGQMALNLSIDCSGGASPGTLSPFWRSVGYTPAEYALRADELENTALIGAVPNRGVTQVRIHYLLDLVTVEGFAPSAATPSGFELSYAWGELDHALDFLVANGLSPGFEFMGSPVGLPAVPASFYNPYNGNGKILPDETFALWRQLCGDVLKRYIGRYGAAEVEAWHLEDWSERARGPLLAPAAAPH